jgi:hypothetical protein
MDIVDVKLVKVTTGKYIKEFILQGFTCFAWLSTLLIPVALVILIQKHLLIQERQTFHWHLLSLPIL